MPPAPGLGDPAGLRLALQHQQVAVPEQRRDGETGDARPMIATSTRRSGWGGGARQSPSRIACMGAKSSPVHSPSRQGGSNAAALGSISCVVRAPRPAIVWRRVTMAASRKLDAARRSIEDGRARH